MQSRILTKAAWIAFWLALAFAVFMALDPKPPQIATVGNDKVEHIAAFATLALLGAIGFPGASLLRLGERLSFLGALIEVMQAIPALGRDCDIRDWIADTAAVALVLLTVALVRRDGPAVPAAPRPLTRLVHIALIALSLAIVVAAALGVLNGPPLAQAAA